MDFNISTIELINIKYLSENLKLNEIYKKIEKQIICEFSDLGYSLYYLSNEDNFYSFSLVELEVVNNYYVPTDLNLTKLVSEILFNFFIKNDTNSLFFEEKFIGHLKENIAPYYKLLSDKNRIDLNNRIKNSFDKLSKLIIELINRIYDNSESFFIELINFNEFYDYYQFVIDEEVFFKFRSSLKEFNSKYIPLWLNTEDLKLIDSYSNL